MKTTISKQPSKIQERRNQLKKNRAKKEWQTIWRLLVAIILLGGLGWLFTLPNWIIRSNNQIVIEGNEILSENAVRDLISLSYPQSIFILPIPKLDRQIESQPPIIDAKVTRQLLPPQINIKITERLPVAIVLDNKSNREALGFADREGIFLPEKFYSSVKENFILPKLTYLGFKQEDSKVWSQLYELISNSSIGVKQIDWRDVNNLILITELGKVHLGADRTIIFEQLKVLEEMGNLSSKIKLQEIDYIDLLDPQNPILEMFEKSSK